MSGGAPAQSRHLWILRHGKAASDAPWGGGDHERPLTARGRRDAAALGKALATGEGPFAAACAVSPQAVVCSAAVRTRQTADLLIDASGIRLPLDEWRSLYEADVDTALEVVRFIDPAAVSALIVGHNPTMHRLAFELLAATDRAPHGRRVRGREALAANEFPTCAIAVVQLPIDDWTEARMGTAELLGLFTPPY